MPSHSIFLSFPAQGWQGPALVQWEPALIEEDRLAMRARGEGEDSDTGKWVTCTLGDIQRVRYCTVKSTGMAPCCHAEVTIRTAGRVYAYASKECLNYLKGRGVAVTEMDQADVAAGRALWRELSRTDESLPAEVCRLVNS